MHIPRLLYLYQRLGWREAHIHLLTHGEIDAGAGTVLRTLQKPEETPEIRRLLDALTRMATVWPELHDPPKGTVLDGLAAVGNWVYRDGRKIGHGIITLESIPKLDLEPWQKSVYRHSYWAKTELIGVSLLTQREAEFSPATPQAVLVGSYETAAARRLLDIIALSGDQHGRGGFTEAFDQLLKIIHQWGIADGRSPDTVHS